MADNVAVTAGSATFTASTEEITTLNGGAVTAQHVQRIIPAVRTADGTAVDVTASAPLPVTMATPTGAATDATLDEITAAIQALALYVDGLEAAIAAQATLLQTQPVSLATVPSHNVTNAGTFAVQAALAASELHLGEIGNALATPSANFTRPSNTTAYALGDLVANSATAGSVVPLSWTATRIATGSVSLRRARLKKSDASVTNASFRLHIYAADPSASTGITNGDNGAWLTKHASWVGCFEISVEKAFSDAAAGVGYPDTGAEINVKLASGSTIYGLLEARAAYTPASAEVFTVELEAFQN